MTNIIRSICAESSSVVSGKESRWRKRFAIELFSQDRYALVASWEDKACK